MFRSGQCLSITMGMAIVATAAQSLAQDAADQPFNTVNRTLKQIVRTTVGDDGRWRLKREHWELVSKRPSDAEKEARKKQQEQMEQNIERWRRANIPEEHITRMTERQGIETTGLVRLVQRLGVESGGRLGFNGAGQSGQTKHGNIGTNLLRGRVEYSAKGELQGPIRFELQEVTGGFRTVTVRDDDDETRIMLRGPGQLVLLERTGQACRVIVAGQGKPTQFVGGSMAAIAKENADSFRDKLNPILTEYGVSPLPIDELLKAQPKEPNNPAPRKLQLEFEELAAERIQAAMHPLLRFKLDGQLQPNDFYGHEDVLTRELKQVRTEYKKTLDAAVARLEKLGAPQSQINELRSQLGGFEPQENQDQFERPLGPAGFGQRVFGGVFGGGGRTGQPPEVKAFRAFQSSVGNVGSSSSSGGQNYEYSFTGRNTTGQLQRKARQYRFKASDSGVTVSTADLDGYVELSIESATGLLVVSQMADGPASALLLGGKEPWFASADSYLSLLVENEEAFRTNILSVTNKLGVSGLDPLSEETTQAVLTTLRAGVPERLSTKDSIAEMDSIVFPLLENKQYLRLLAERLDGDDKALIQKRLSQLK